MKIYLGKKKKTDYYWDPSQEINQHLLIVGQSGSGKTSCIKTILFSLKNSNVPLIILDFHNEYGDVAEKIDFMGDYFINPLDLMGIGPIEQSERITEIIDNIYLLGVRQRRLIMRAIEESYQSKGIKNNDKKTWNKNAPTFRDVEKILKKYETDTKTTEEKTRAISVFDRLHPLFNNPSFSGTKKIKFEDYTDKRISFQLKNLFSEEVRITVAEFILYGLWHFFYKQGGSETPLCIVLDESHRLAYKGSPVDTLLREARKYKLSVIISSQTPADFSREILANIATTISFNLPNPLDRNFIAKKLRCKESDLSELKQLEMLISSSKENRFDKIMMTYFSNLKEQKLEKKQEPVFRELTERFNHNHILGELILNIKDIKYDLVSKKIDFIPFLLFKTVYVHQDIPEINFKKTYVCRLDKDVVFFENIKFVGETKEIDGPKAELTLDSKTVFSKGLNDSMGEIIGQYFYHQTTHFYSKNKKEVLKNIFDSLQTEINEKMEDKLNKFHNKKERLALKIEETKERLSLETEAFKNLTGGLAEKQLQQLRKQKVAFAMIVSEDNKSLSKQNKIDRLDSTLKFQKKLLEQVELEKDRYIKKIETDYMNKSEKLLTSFEIKPEKEMFSICDVQYLFAPVSTVEFNLHAEKNSKKLRINYDWLGINELGNCSTCFKKIKKDVYVCYSCAKLNCVDHGYSCVICQKRACKSHLVKCHVCAKYVCEEDMRTCPGCKNEICKKEIVKCQSCNKSVCKNCLRSGKLLFFRTGVMSRCIFCDA